MQEENLLIPIHAYPIMNETKFPKRLDFGKCALGDMVTKTVKMECKVPVEFEFSITQVGSATLWFCIGQLRSGQHTYNIRF